MKTNLVKKGSEKNIEMFQMSNEELASVNGGKMEMYKDEDGNWVFVYRPGVVSSYLKSFFSRD